ncbi:trihelix transcription factor ENAP1 isoform X2 [Spinacia oleracea]|uniref:Trihelix transcription factor ENAP1 isoform X2 n=1 Tax=Spinacia oleracea TaxID=3562 RepID=A0A9R0HV40_SPIOL|nr:trihelix transcription factor ENAP1 isoform X2 [Spinacia oleracea]
MDRRLNYPYSRRSKPQKSYAEEDDDEENDAVLGVIGNSDDEDDDDDNDEDFNGQHRRHTPTRQRRKLRKLSNWNYHSTPTPSGISDWLEQGTFILLEIWGERFLQLGRSSLRSEDWNDVAERVSEATRSNRTVSDCRNRLNALKMKYKREKAKVISLGGGSSKWVYFKKMDVLMTMSPRQLQQQEQCGLACGVDSGEFVFMNPRVYLDHSNASDEMRDSPGNSESEGGEDDEEEEEDDDEENEEEAEESYRMLSESIKRVGVIYEKMEDSKKQHMEELDRMREEFQRELELQKKEMLDQTKSEIAKLGQKDDQDSDCSVENVSEL